MRRLAPHILLFVFCLGASLPANAHDASPIATATAALDGRLGGNRSSFEREYGPPIADEGGSFAHYGIVGFSSVNVDFIGETVVTINLIGDRKGKRATPVTKGWPPEEAYEIA